MCTCTLDIHVQRRNIRISLAYDDVHVNTQRLFERNYQKSIEVLHIFVYIPRMAKRVDGKVYYTAGEVAEMAGVHRLTLLRWIREGKLAEVDRDRNGWRLFSEEIAYQISEFAKGVNVRSSPNQGLLFTRKNLEDSNTFQKSVLNTSE
jgi:excisionase family DNA binding protein